MFCDLCGSEIKNGTLAGGIMRQIEQFSLNKLPVAFPQSSHKISHNSKHPSQILQKKIDTEIWDLCEGCQEWIWDSIKEKQKNLLQEKSDFVLIANLSKPISQKRNGTIN